MFAFKTEIEKANQKIKKYVRETPLDYSVALSKITGANVFLKCENLQYTGAFKARGAFNKLLSLSDEEKKRGVVAASSGNHGAAIAFGLSSLKIPGIVFVPENASQTKVDNINNYEIPLEFFGTDCMQTEMHALAYAKEKNMVYVSPYNDYEVIAGQGTIGLEIVQQLKQIDAVLVPVGGGGLISGIASYIKSVSSQTKMIGCLPENSPVMSECLKAGKIIEIETFPTLSDATAGNLEPDSITFDICRQFVDETILVSEDEIKHALISLIKTQHLLVEGAAGVALASLFKKQNEFKNKNIVVVLSGANISLVTLTSILTQRIN